MKTLLKQPSAWIPLVMSVSAFTLLIVYLILFGTTQTVDGDEGIAARLFQLLLISQVPFIIYFAIKNSKKNRKITLKILGLQFITAISVISLVYIIEIIS